MTSNKIQMIQKLGSEEAYQEWLKANAAKGGSRKVKKGMAALTPEQASAQARARALKRWAK